ncbi:MAG: bile acid:sodium symporter [Nitrospirota bacterium]
MKRAAPRNLKISLVRVAANLLVPLGFIFVVSRVMGFWHNFDEMPNILVGLALIVSMPIAGSSTAWTQNANGNMTIGLGLVLATTFLSPFTTPLVLHVVGAITTCDYSEDLHEWATHGTGMFLAICVILPSVMGILLRVLIDMNRMVAAKPYLKLINSTVLLVVIYSNASIALPKAVSQPDVDFLTVMLGIATSLCVLAFFSRWVLSCLLQTDPAQRTALMFGLGMNNNGTGLVLASMALADHPPVLLPIIM